MNSSREEFLIRVRQSVSAGNRLGAAIGTIGPRGKMGYQGAGSDPVSHFREQFTALGGVFHLVAEVASCGQIIRNLVLEKSAKHLLLGSGEFLGQLNLGSLLQESGVKIISIRDLTLDSCQAIFFGADIGISGVDYLIAETGTVVLHSRSDQPRSLSLLPPIHIAIAERRQLIDDLFELFDAPDGKPLESLPSCTTLITGPSKTGDIELKLVTGVHGPGEIHVILIDN
jgi:L-lactate utilization protein LutC